jgi:hypothetical protein
VPWHHQVDSRIRIGLVSLYVVLHRACARVLGVTPNTVHRDGPTRLCQRRIVGTLQTLRFEGKLYKERRT